MSTAPARLIQSRSADTSDQQLPLAGRTANHPSAMILMYACPNSADRHDRDVRRQFTVACTSCPG
jgi:hypothetical protein